MAAAELLSDHVSIDFSIVGKSRSVDDSISVPSYNFKSANFSAIPEFLIMCNWDQLLNSCFTVESKWNVFCNILSYACELYVPKFIPRCGKLVYPDYIVPLLKQNAKVPKIPKF